MSADTPTYTLHSDSTDASTLVLAGDWVQGQSHGDFGALQNRLESAVRNMQNVVENQSSARSRVRDADFAAETANLTRNQILKQAGTAMLSQANSQPQSVLSLLG